MSPSPPTNLDLIDPSQPHSLLASPHAAYSHLTLRRAFITWLHCGANNHFQEVCDYYHRLEEMEETLPANRRASSRYHEFHLFYNNPPKSTFLLKHFPNLYSHQHVDSNHVKRLEAIRNEQFVFRLEGFDEVDCGGASKDDVILLSQMITNYCRERLINTRKFLANFKEYLRKCRLQFNVDVLKMFVRKKAIKEEIQLEARMPIDFRFLHDDEAARKNEKDDGATDKNGIGEGPTDQNETPDGVFKKAVDKTATCNNIEAKIETGITKKIIIDTKLEKPLIDFTNPHQNEMVFFKNVMNKPIHTVDLAANEYFDFSTSQTKLVTATEFNQVSKDEEVEVIDVDDCNDSDVTEYSDFVNFIDDFDKSSVTDGESGIDCKSGDEIGNLIMKENGMNGVGVEIINLGFPQKRFIKLEKCQY